jgi:tetratricopeptide (TPR) repeat protein
MRPSQLKSLTTMAKPGRNDPCPCGSGNKYKKCCLPKEEAVEHEQLAKAEARRAERAAAHRLHLREVKAAIAARLSGTEDGDEDELTIASNAAADLVRAGKLDEAVQAARDLLVRFPEVHDGYDRLGMVYEARGEDQQAADCYRKVIAFVREHPDDYDPGFEDVLCQARGSARPAGRHLIAAILLAIREGNIPAPITNHPHVVRAPPSTCGRRVSKSPPLGRGQPVPRTRHPSAFQRLGHRCPKRPPASSRALGCPPTFQTRDQLRALRSNLLVDPEMLLDLGYPREKVVNFFREPGITGALLF